VAVRPVRSSSDVATRFSRLSRRLRAATFSGIDASVADDLVVEWPVSGERIVGRGNYLSINAEFPERWAIRVLRIVEDGEVPHDTMGFTVWRRSGQFGTGGSSVAGSTGRVWGRTVAGVAGRLSAAAVTEGSVEPLRSRVS